MFPSFSNSPADSNSPTDSNSISTTNTNLNRLMRKGGLERKTFYLNSLDYNMNIKLKFFSQNRVLGFNYNMINVKIKKLGILKNGF